MYLAGRTPLGVRVRIGGRPDSLAYTIVGVVDDVHHNGLTREVKAQFYAPLAQFARAPGNTMRTMNLVIRTDGDPRGAHRPGARADRKADPRLPVSEVRTLDDVVANSIAAPRFAMQLLGSFGVLALVARGDRDLRRRIAGGGDARARIRHSRRRSARARRSW